MPIINQNNNQIPMTQAKYSKSKTTKQRIIHNRPINSAQPPKPKSSQIEQQEFDKDILNKHPLNAIKQPNEPVQSEFRTLICDKMNLCEYYDLFVQKGFDDIDVFKLLNDQDLKDIGVDKKGSRMKMIMYGQKQKEAEKENDIIQNALDEMEESETTKSAKSVDLNDDDIKSEMKEESFEQSETKTKTQSKYKAAKMRSETKSKYAKEEYEKETIDPKHAEEYSNYHRLETEMPAKNLNIGQRKEARAFPLKIDEKNEEHLSKIGAKTKAYSEKKKETENDFEPEPETEKISKAEVSFNRSLEKTEDSLPMPLIPKDVKAEIATSDDYDADNDVVKFKTDTVVDDEKEEKKEDAISEIEVNDNDRMRSVLENSENAIFDSKKASIGTGRYYHDEVQQLKPMKRAFEREPPIKSELFDKKASMSSSRPLSNHGKYGAKGKDEYLDSVIANANNKGKGKGKEAWQLNDNNKKKKSSVVPRFKFSDVERQFKPYQMHMHDDRAINRSNNAHLFGVSILVMLLSGIFVSIAYMGYKFIKNKAD